MGLIRRPPLASIHPTQLSCKNRNWNCGLCKLNIGAARSGFNKVAGVGQARSEGLTSSFSGRRACFSPHAIHETRGITRGKVDRIPGGRRDFPEGYDGSKGRSGQGREGQGSPAVVSRTIRGRPRDQVVLAVPIDAQEVAKTIWSPFEADRVRMPQRRWSR